MHICFTEAVFRRKEFKIDITIVLIRKQRLPIYEAIPLTNDKN